MGSGAALISASSLRTPAAANIVMRLPRQGAKSAMSHRYHRISYRRGQCPHRSGHRLLRRHARHLEHRRRSNLRELANIMLERAYAPSFMMAWHRSSTPTGAVPRERIVRFMGAKGAAPTTQSRIFAQPCARCGITPDDEGCSPIHSLGMNADEIEAFVGASTMGCTVCSLIH